MLLGVPEWSPLDEQERVSIVRGILERHPEHDFANSLSGAMLGPASPDRPDVPVWEYPDFAAANPSVPLSALTAVRFPVLFFEGQSSVTSIDEELRPPPSHLRHAPSEAFVIDAEAIIRRWAMEHDAGLLRWDSTIRGIRCLAPVGLRRPVLQEWVATLSAAG